MAPFAQESRLLGWRAIILPNVQFMINDFRRDGPGLRVAAGRVAEAVIRL
jgi:hypothetical protein